MNPPHADIDEFDPMGVGDCRLRQALRGQAPINLARAYEIMELHDLQGIVVGEPLNVFHLTGYWPQLSRTKTGQPPSTFVLLSRDPKLERGLVTSQFIYYYTLADAEFAQAWKTYLFLETGDEAAIVDEGAAVERPLAQPPDTIDFPDRAVAPLSPIERQRRAAADTALARHGLRPDTGAALVRALRDMGLWQGRIAADHEAISGVCRRHGHPGRLVAADNILRQIRIVKSALEIELMRRASAANVAAVHATAAAIRAGQSYFELHRVFQREAAARGNQPVFMTIDRVSSPLADGRVANGQAFFIDGVSHYENYHGDYARTIFVGEPARPMKCAADAVAIGWDAIRERLRPGVRYSELTAVGRAAVRKAGFEFSVGFGPHSVGLSHTDEPGQESGGFYAKEDLILQANMTLSVDCPLVDTGLGGSAHLEDLMLITQDGAEPLHAIGAAAITV